MTPFRCRSAYNGQKPKKDFIHDNLRVANPQIGGGFVEMVRTAIRGMPMLVS